MSIDPDPRYAETLKPLIEFCERHDYRWRWKLEKPDQWHASIQVLDPRKHDRSDKVRAWYSAACVDEIAALQLAVTLAIDGAQKRLDEDARLRAWGVPDRP